ncbi:MAG TPA: lysylphosphatidylglycerol synthase transmembrane domain-containing protein [Gemmatimonadaceae bacterium]|nr:lysylphosphatidylglycerol synthase transmembrane domain-containing protein [Gemmatimonadaceae bacterium]
MTAHLLALAAVAVETVSRASKLTLSARAIGEKLSLGTALRTSLGGDFAAAITPARSGAEPARFLILTEAGVRPAPALVVLFLELALELLSLAVLAIAAVVVFRGEGTMLNAVSAMLGGYATFVIALGVAAYLLSRGRTGGPPPDWARSLRVNAFAWRWVQRALRHLRASVEGVRNAHNGWLILAFLASVTHIAARLTILPAIVLSYDRSGAVAPLVFWPLALVYGGAAVPAPAGGGIMEVAFKATLSAAIPAAIFGAALIWWRFYTFYIYVPLGALAAGHLVLRAMRRPDRDTTT